MPRMHTALSPAPLTAARVLAAVTLLALPTTAARASAQAPRLGEASIDDVVQAMTTEEKVSLLVGMGMNLPFALPGLPNPSAEDRAVPERVPGAAGRTHAIDRLGIPSITLSDGPAGVRIDPTREGDDRTYHATAFPVATLLASSWDPALAEAVGAAFGRELREYGADVLLAPGMNLHRNPLGGRNFEYYSEDPLLTGRMAAGFVNGVESEGVGTSPKHFAVNSQEFNRLRSNSIIGQRALRELYLRGFEIAVTEAQPWTVMSAYNKVNGTYASQSRALLTTILREEWGFDGFVMTDWFAGDDPVAMMEAGNDVLMPGGVDQSEAIIAAVESGELSEAQLDTNVRRVLGIILESPTFKGYDYSDQPDLDAHARVARDAATQGMVLLKNENDALPLAAGAAALFGNASYRPIIGGTGSGEVNEAYRVALAEGLENAGFTVDPAVIRAYETYLEAEEADRPPGNILMPPPPIEEMDVDAAMIRDAAARADVGLYTLGRNSGEGGDRKVSGDFDLTEREVALIRSLSDTFRAEGKPFVVVMNVAGVTEVASWRDAADAILLAWQPGQETGNAIADVLSGAVNPSGKLPMSFPMVYADVPSAGTFPGEVLPEYADQEQPEGLMAMLNPTPSRAIYDEGIFVGYRYYDTFDVAPAYPFGFGLSYTTFEYGDLTLSADRFDGEITATVTVTDAGDVAGREVVQLYVSAPDGALVKPASELRAFAKTGVLRPGASETVVFTLGSRDLASFDEDRSAWIVEGGEYVVRAAASSRDTRAEARFSVPETIVVEEVHDVLAPELEIDLLLP